jgi:hypothetical protein
VERAAPDVLQPLLRRSVLHAADDEEHAGREHGAAEHDLGGAEPAQRVLDQKVRRTPERGECAEEDRVARRHAAADSGFLLSPPPLSDFFSAGLESDFVLLSPPPSCCSRWRLRVP